MTCHRSHKALCLRSFYYRPAGRQMLRGRLTNAAFTHSRSGESIFETKTKEARGRTTSPELVRQELAFWCRCRCASAEQDAGGLAASNVAVGITVVQQVDVDRAGSRGVMSSGT